MLSQEQITLIRKKLREQIQTLPDEQKEEAMKQIDSMSPEQLESIISNKQGGECIFCSIASGKISSFPIASSETAIAVLDINPYAVGHTLVIPKVHVSILGEETKKFASEVSKKLSLALGVEKIESEETTLSGHTAINFLPIHAGEKPSSERKKTTPEELKALQEKIKLNSEKKVSEEKEQQEKKLEAEKEMKKEQKPLEKAPRRRP
jgi:histidine triad (HIT) family protein